MSSSLFFFSHIFHLIYIINSTYRRIISTASSSNKIESKSHLLLVLFSFTSSLFFLSRFSPGQPKATSKLPPLNAPRHLWAFSLSPYKHQTQAEEETKNISIDLPTHHESRYTSSNVCGSSIITLSLIFDPSVIQQSVSFSCILFTDSLFQQSWVPALTPALVDIYILFCDLSTSPTSCTQTDLSTLDLPFYTSNMYDIFSPILTQS